MLHTFPSRFKFFMKYTFGACCASAQREQEMLERMHRIEQKLDIHTAAPLPLEPLRDPFELYDEACVEFYSASSRHQGKQHVDEDKEYHEDDEDDDDDGGDRDNDEDYNDEQSFLSRGLHFWHLLTKGECQTLILL